MAAKSSGAKGSGPGMHKPYPSPPKVAIKQATRAVNPASNVKGQGGRKAVGPTAWPVVSVPSVPGQPPSNRRSTRNVSPRPQAERYGETTGTGGGTIPQPKGKRGGGKGGSGAR